MSKKTSDVLHKEEVVGTVVAKKIIKEVVGAMMMKEILHGFAENSSNCPHCGAPPSEHEVRNHDLVMHDGDVYCTKCNGYVRMYDAG